MHEQDPVITAAVEGEYDHSPDDPGACGCGQIPGALRHGRAEPERSDRYEFDKWTWPASEHWPDGLQIQVYDDGRVKVGGWRTRVEVLQVATYGAGDSKASSHVVARFRPAPGQGEGSR